VRKTASRRRGHALLNVSSFEKKTRIFPTAL
jgi:hypothetical protein